MPLLYIDIYLPYYLSRYLYDGRPPSSYPAPQVVFMPMRERVCPGGRTVLGATGLVQGRVGGGVVQVFAQVLLRVILLPPAVAAPLPVSPGVPGANNRGQPGRAHVPVSLSACHRPPN